MTQGTAVRTRTPASRRTMARRERFLALALVAMGSLAIFLPIGYLVGNSLSARETAKSVPPSMIPFETVKAEVDGASQFVYRVKVDGTDRSLAVVERKGSTWVYADPAHPDQRWELPAAGPEQRVTEPRLHPENFPYTLVKAPFGKYILNTLVIMAFVTLGTLVSSIMVAYGFSRFRLKGMRILFMVLLSTIMLPSQVVLIPTFILFKSLGLFNTWFPLIIPAFFANAWDVFLFRQFFMGLPKELDESAKMDGCGPVRTLWFILLPQAWPVVLTVALFTMVFVWNDFFTPLIYLQNAELFTVSLGLESFSALYTSQKHLEAAGAVLMLLPPVLVFFLAQRYFIQGTVVSGVKG